MSGFRRLPHEVWAQIPSLPKYEISNHGRLRGSKGIQKAKKDHTGTMVVTVSKPGGYTGNVRIARLVGEVFCPDFRPELRPVYLDGDRTNLKPTNLKWVPQSQVTGVPYSKNPRALRAAGLCD